MKRLFIIIPLFIAFSCDLDDSTPPIVRILSPSQGQKLQGVCNVEILVEDNKSVIFLTVKLNDDVLTTIENEPYEFSRDVYLWNTENHINGEYTLSAQALDGSGNEGFSSPVLVSIENSK